MKIQKLVHTQELKIQIKDWNCKEMVSFIILLGQVKLITCRALAQVSGGGQGGVGGLESRDRGGTGGRRREGGKQGSQDGGNWVILQLKYLIT